MKIRRNHYLDMKSKFNLILNVEQYKHIVA